jgi:hypothetical protein
MKLKYCETDECLEQFELFTKGGPPRKYCDECKRVRNLNYQRAVRAGKRKVTRPYKGEFRKPVLSDVTHCRHCGHKLAESNATGECNRNCRDDNPSFVAGERTPNVLKTGGVWSVLR